jgi:Zn-dependent metalloprotease
MLKNLAENGDEQQREKAIRSLITGAHFRARREVLGQITLATPAGGLRRSIYDCKHKMQLPGRLVRTEGAKDSKDAAVNEAYNGLGQTYKLYKDAFGRNSIDNKGLRLNASVHYGADYDNAFWDGSQMVFGDGDNRIFVGFTKSLDVIGHELTHGVTQYEANLEYQDQPGALNESMSDVFGSLVKQHALNQTAADADWLIGSGLLAPGIQGVALRSMKEPGTAYDDPLLGKDPQPGHMSDYDHTTDDFGGVHINSGIPNRAFYLVAEQIGGYAWKDAGRIWYLTLRRLHSQSDFQDAANVTFQVAGELFGTGSRQQQAVRTAWDEVGIQVSAAAPRRAPAPAGVGNGHPAVEGNGARLEEKVDHLVDAVGRLVEVLAENR